jgi:ABC-type transport system substrate-binding protein
VIGKYPQFKFWLAMTMFVPIPWEADRFYAQRGMADNALSFNSWPIGTGPFMLAEQGANRYVLQRNPNYREELYPADGMPGDREHGWLNDAGKRLPFLDKVVFYLEKEREPEESKFMQGYYDNPDVSRLDIGFALLKEQMDKTGRWEAIRDHGIQMVSTLEPSNWYIGFNMLDPVVGKGDTPEQQEKNRKLRQALSITTDWEEYAIVFFDNYGRRRRRWARSRRAVRPCHRRGRDESGHARVEGRQGGAPSDRGREEAAGRGGYPTAATRRPASRWSSSTIRTASVRPIRRGSTGRPSSSRSSASSARFARTTTTASRTGCARAMRRSTSGAGSPTIPIRKTICSC